MDCEGDVGLDASPPTPRPIPMVVTAGPVVEQAWNETGC